MRFARFRHHDAVRFGILEETEVRPFDGGIDSLEAFLAVPAAERRHLTTSHPTAPATVELLAPVVPRKNVFCVGRNYKGHAEEIARARGIELKLPAVPTFFTKAPTAISDPGATVRFSRAVSEQYDFEAELAVVIGERCRDVAPEDALDVVFGYTCVDDLTARDLQQAHGQWFKGKSLDGSCPIGPWIVSADELGDPQALDVLLRVNGHAKQHGNTRDMIFDVRAIVAALSRGMTLEPGDVIATGTPDGVGMARTPPEWLADGDVVEVEIAGIGVLRTTIALD